jgi:flagellar assembly factor FliW
MEGARVMEKDPQDSNTLCRPITFPWGMPGLDDNEYLLESNSEESPFFLLQSAAEPEVALLLVNPFTVYTDYEFDLSDDILEKLKISDTSQVAVFCTVNTSCGIDSATVNLLAPIVINTKELLGKQVVLNDKKYSLRTPLSISREEKEEGR